MRTLFGTDGVRGLANVEPMTGETVMRLGRAAAAIFKNGSGRHRIVIGKDTRRSGYMLESALTSGICSMGVDVIQVGPMPTPAVAFLTRSLRADAGIMISASHNSFEDNGIKFFCREGLKLPDEMERRIEAFVLDDVLSATLPTADAIGRAYRVEGAEGRYVEFVKNSLPRGLDFQGLKVVVDCAHGAAYKVAPTVLRELGAEVTVIGDTPNGININRDCGAVHPDALQKEVVARGADVGVAHDGDADRTVFVAETGDVIHGDAVLAAFAFALHQDGLLRQNRVVATVMSNIGLQTALQTRGISLIRTDVGDRYVLERLLKEGGNFGGESSGHVVFLDHNTTGDGLITALQWLCLMKKTGKTASNLAACLTLLPQVTINVRVARKDNLADVPGFSSALARCEGTLNGRGRILARYSGTEMLFRVMVEGEDATCIQTVANDLADRVRQHAGIQEGR